MNILVQWRHLAEIFIFIKMISHVRFIILVHQIVILVLLIPTKLTITKIHHLIRMRFERSEHKKSQCARECPRKNPISTHSAPPDFQSFLQPFKVRSDGPPAYLPHSSRPTWTTISMSKIQCQVSGQRIATNLIYLCLGDP